ncbi:hypothetical protein E3U43_003086 [Larimichthys crocea]|uniref:Uncharacterized protein n=1 Tax=Larimichthys crocea TaxID=215358 RepID=A0ACD3RH67_LARCR|nr:hypothetical protein E3U43_003086 [Larimichthys crocea]
MDVNEGQGRSCRRKLPPSLFSLLTAGHSEGMASQPLFEDLCLRIDSILLSLILVSGKEDSEFYFKTSQDHNCRDITTHRNL